MPETPTATSPQPPQPSQPPQPPVRRRGGQSAGDMLRSLALVLLVVGLVFVFTVRDPPDDPGPEIGYRQQLAQTRAVAPYDVLAPVGLGARWKATSARGGQDGGSVTWHLGLVSPAGDYAAVEQSDGPVRGFLDEHVAGAGRAGAVSVGGRTWQRLTGGTPDDHALLLPDPDVTTLVTGSASFDELRALARSLRGSRSRSGDRLPQPYAPGPSAGSSCVTGCDAASRARAPSSHSWQIVASCSPRSQRVRDSSRVAAPVSSRRTTSTSSSRACS